jgi:transposase
VFRCRGGTVCQTSTTRRRWPGERPRAEAGAQPRGGGIAPRLAAHEEAVRRPIGERPGTTIAQLRAWLLWQRGVSASYGAVWKTLTPLGLTQKT